MNEGHWFCLSDALVRYSRDSGNYSSYKAKLFVEIAVRSKGDFDDCSNFRGDILFWG